MNFKSSIWMQINPSDPFNWDVDSRAMIEKECCKKRIKFDRPSLAQLFQQRLSSLQCRRCSLWEKPLSPAPAAKEPAGQHKAGVLTRSRKAVRKSNLRALQWHRYSPWERTITRSSSVIWIPLLKLSFVQES